MPSQVLPRRRGAALTELPVLLFVVFIVIALPLIGLATFAYRDALFSFAIKNACTDASKAPSFGAAQASAQASLSTACGAFAGVKLQRCQVSIVCKSLSGGSEVEVRMPLNPATIDARKNLYFIKVTADGLIEPVVRFGGGSLGMAPIPGFSAPYPLRGSCQLFFERPTGLSR